MAIDKIYSSYILCLSCIFFSCFSGCFLFCEIETVTLKWTSLLCTQVCMTQLEREFRKVPGIAEVALDQGSGGATIKWRPNYRFSFSDVNVPMRLVGLSIRDIHIKVKGKLSHDAHSVFLTSIGDNTQFQLLNPVTSTSGQQAAVFNLAARQLTPELRQKLLEGEAQKATASIQGQIFMPGRSSALQIVVDSLNLEKEDTEKQKQK
ncbi:MAG: hypothetical protein H0X29_03010 [Parachlamydiaceae bacterium]|nr:hypothetical protein [Parachlamydiaceae bacterium]